MMNSRIMTSSILNPLSSIPSSHQDPLAWILQVQQRGQVVAKIARKQEMLADKLMTDPSHALAFVGIAQQVANPIGGTFRGMDQETGMIVVDLQGDAAAGAADHRLAFPKRFRHRQAKTFLHRLLQDD